MPSHPHLPVGWVIVLAVVSLLPALDGQGGRSRLLQRIRLVERFDADENGRLDTKERAAARKWVQENPRRRRRGFRGRRGNTGDAAGDIEQEPILPMKVPHYPGKKLYDPAVLRTVFLSFPQKDWSKELADFFLTDVDVPATMFVDGKKYADVGVRYRGSSSYLFVAANKKKPLNISIDFVHTRQRLQGNRTLNLTNASQDASMVREVVFADIARRYVPTSRVNYVKLVINGETWGVYVNVQQFNKDFLDDWFGSRKGVRWKIQRNYGGVGALTYLGDDPARYRAAYELKTTGSESGDAEAWKRLIRLTKLLKETSDNDKQAVLSKVLDIDRTCWFLALEWVFKDSDGYVRQGYDYRLFEDKHGRFLPLPYDNNEILPVPRRGRFAGRMVRGQRPIGNDPLEQLDNEERPLISVLLAVPAWRARYLAHVRTLTSHWLDWQNLGPLCRRYHEMIDKEVQKDPRKLYSYERFEDGLDELQDIAQARRRDVLAHPALEGPWPVITSVSHQTLADKTGGRRLRVTARLGKGKEAAVDKVILHVRDKRSRLFRTVVMHDDGEHGDGTAGDQVFCGDTETFSAGTKIRYYVEARAPESIGTTTFHPARAEAGAVRYRF